MWPHASLHDAWLLSLPALVPYMILMSLKMMERQTPFTSETFLHEYDYIVGKLRPLRYCCCSASVGIRIPLMVE